MLKLPRDMNHCGMTHSVVLTPLPRRRRGKYNSSHTSSEYETLNRRFFSPLTTNRNTEDEQNKNTLLPYGSLQDWGGTSGIAHGSPCQWERPHPRWLSVTFLQHCSVMLPQASVCTGHFLLGVSHCCHSQLGEPGLSLLHN